MLERSLSARFDEIYFVSFGLRMLETAIFCCGENQQFCHVKKSPKQNGQGNFLKKSQKIVTFQERKL
jgi:hypothetical protein